MAPRLLTPLGRARAAALTSAVRSEIVLLTALTALALTLTRTTSAHRREGERGDVPGWVLITLMTAGLVTVLWQLAGDQLQALFTKAISGVTGPGAK